MLHAEKSHFAHRRLRLRPCALPPGKPTDHRPWLPLPILPADERLRFAVNAMIEADRVTSIGDGEPEAVHTPSALPAGQKVRRCPHCFVALWSHHSLLGDAIAMRQCRHARRGRATGPRRPLLHGDQTPMGRTLPTAFRPLRVATSRPRSVVAEAALRLEAALGRPPGPSPQPSLGRAAAPEAPRADLRPAGASCRTGPAPDRRGGLRLRSLPGALLVAVAGCIAGSRSRRRPAAAGRRRARAPGGPPTRANSRSRGRVAAAALRLCGAEPVEVGAAAACASDELAAALASGAAAGAYLRRKHEHSAGRPARVRLGVPVRARALDRGLRRCTDTARGARCRCGPGIGRSGGAVRRTERRCRRRSG